LLEDQLACKLADQSQKFTQDSFTKEDEAAELMRYALGFQALPFNYNFA